MSMEPLQATMMSLVRENSYYWPGQPSPAEPKASFASKSDATESEESCPVDADASLDAPSAHVDLSPEISML